MLLFVGHSRHSIGFKYSRPRCKGRNLCRESVLITVPLVWSPINMLNTMKFVTFKTLLSILWIHCEAYSFSDEQSLHTTIFNSSYDNNMRPGQNRAIPLQINITFYFKSIKEFDESVSKFSITGALEVSWLDHRLTWDPATYGKSKTSQSFLRKKYGFHFW